MKYILAHDLGTSGNKATLFSESGALVASEVYSYGCHYFHEIWAEQDPEDWWRAICTTTRNLIAKAAIEPAQIAAVSFSGQMMGCLCVDRDGTPLRPSIIWADQRAQAQQGPGGNPAGSVNNLNFTPASGRTRRRAAARRRPRPGDPARPP